MRNGIRMPSLKPRAKDKCSIIPSGKWTAAVYSKRKIQPTREKIHAPLQEASMLQVHFCEMPDAIYNPSMYFKNTKSSLLTRGWPP